MAKKLTPFKFLSEIKKILSKYGPIFSKTEINQIRESIDEKNVAKLLEDLDWVNHIVSSNPFEKINFNLPGQYETTKEIYKIEDYINTYKAAYKQEINTLNEFLLKITPHINALLKMEIKEEESLLKKLKKIILRGNK